MLPFVSFKLWRPIHAPEASAAKSDFREIKPHSYPEGVASQSPGLPRSGYPGKGGKVQFYPEGVASPFCIGSMQPFRGNPVAAFFSQGSRFAATLGFGMQPLRGKWNEDTLFSFVTNSGPAN